MQSHSFDAALVLEPLEALAQPQPLALSALLEPPATRELPALKQLTFSGHTSPAYANMVGPYGGLSAAVLLQAVLKHPALLGAPVSLTINFCAGMADGAYAVHAQPMRTNRSTQHWVVSLTQLNAQGDADTVLTGTVITAVRRSTWGFNESPLPNVPSPANVPLETRVPFLHFLKCYELRFVTGAVPNSTNATNDANGRGADAARNAVAGPPPDAPGNTLTQLWVRDNPPRPLDFLSLVAMVDIFIPRIFLRRAKRVPLGTVTMTVYFHADAALLAKSGTGYLLGQARGQAIHDGYFDHNAQMWSEQGALLATSQQLVYFRE